MENFKNYLETQLNIIEIKLKGILVEIENIPDPSDIDLTIYGSKEQIKKEYNKKVKVSLFKKIIGPSMGDLKEYLRDREISRLSKLKLRYERQISQIKQAISYLYGNGTTEIYPNDEIIRFLFKYVSIHNINPSDVLRYLIDICETSLDRTNVEDKMKRNLTSFFDYEGNIHKEAKISTIYLILDKLFASVFTEQELEEYNIIINQLYVQIRLDKDKISKKDSKPELELKRKALIELQEHISGTSIIKTLDLKSFKLLLDTAGIDKQIQEILLKKMEKKIKEEDLAFQRQRTIEAMNMFLSDEDIELIKQAEVKENTLIGPLNELVSRAKKDVISMCKYLSLFDPTSDVHDALEILNDRLRVLKHVLLNIDEEHKESNTLFYVTDKDGVPFILRNLELHQISEYNNIYNLLYKVSSNTKGKKYISKDGIDFYYIGYGNLKIVYTEFKDNRIIVGIDSVNPTFHMKSYITSDVIDQINEIEYRSINSSFKEIHTTYENVILEALNIRESSYSLTLKKKED